VISRGNQMQRGRVAGRGRVPGFRAFLSLTGGLALMGALITSASASDVVTINTTEQYVDPSIAAAFVTTPNLCTEPIGMQGTSPTACDALGLAAVIAATGTGPDVYFEPAGSQLQAKNAFVPNNPGSTVGATGYAPIFSQHKYDLFGDSKDIMGPYTREEHLFLIAINSITTGGGATNGQTTPGEDTLLKFLSFLLAQDQGVTTFNHAGYTFDIANLPTYQRVTGFNSGQWTTVRNWCIGYPLPVAFCDADRVQTAGLYLQLNGFADVAPSSCGPLGPADCGNRDQWVDQIVVGYVQSWESLGGDQHFVQNFRSQVGYDPTALILDASTSVYTDFRMEQSVELSGAFTTVASDPTDTIGLDNQDFVAGRQTIQQAITTESTDEFGWLYNQKQAPSIGDLVSQDVNGYFFSCLNCDNPTQNIVHVFTPLLLDLYYQPYDAGWNRVPTVTHAGVN
jgi:hypothetical protein